MVFQVPDQSRFHCRVVYEDSVAAPLRGSHELEESVGIYLKENYEQISIPVPDFSNTDPADIIHDFNRVTLLALVICTNTNTSTEYAFNVLCLDFRV